MKEHVEKANTIATRLLEASESYPDNQDQLIEVKHNLAMSAVGLDDVVFLPQNPGEQPLKRKVELAS